MGFRHYSRANPCPVCGSDHYCGFSADGRVINCTFTLRNASEAAKPAPPGYQLWKASKAEHVGMLYRLLGPDGKPVAGEADEKTLEQEQARKALYKARMIERAAEQWAAANRQPGRGMNHPRVAAYLEARGIPVARLPGGVVPEAIRFVPDALDEWDKEAKRYTRCPAMIVRTVDVAGRGQGLHLTYLDPAGAPRKRSEEAAAGGKAKRMIGPMVGCAGRLGRDPSRGALCLTEGLENALSVMAATGLPAWYLGSAAHLQAIDLHPGMFFPKGPIHTVILCGDYNKNQTGQRAVAIAANTLKARHPWLRIYERFPGPADVPDAFEGESLAKGVKGVDWNDALQATGLERVAASVMEGIDLEANAREVREKCEGGQNSPEPDEGGGVTQTGGTRADISFGGGGGPPRGGSGMRDGVASGGGESSDVVGLIADEVRPGGVGAWEAGDPLRMPILEDGPVQRARRWLVERWKLGAHGRFAVARWAGKWWVYAAGRYVEVSQERFSAQALHWLNGFATLREFKSRPDEVRPLNPSDETAAELLKALVIDTNVDGRTMPRWLDPVIDRDGRPMWGHAVATEHLVAFEDEVDREAGAQIIGTNGRIDLHQVVATEEVRLLPHTPELFNTVALPFKLDVEMLEGLVQGGQAERIYAKVCPAWMEYLKLASNGDERWVRQLQLMFGDTISGDRSMQSIFVVVGAPNAGKTTVETALKHVVGTGNVAAPSLSSIASEFGLAPLVGKSAVIFSDAQLRQFTDSDGVTEILKTVSGNGSIQVRDLYRSAQTVVLGCRFWIFCNEMPDLRDDSGGLARRLNVLPMLHPIQNADPRAMDRIVEEAPGILLWAIVGAVQLAKMERRMIPMCDQGSDAVAENTRRGAHIKAFRDECMVRGEQHSTTPDDLYAAYKKWCENDLGREPVGKPRFFASLRWLLAGAYKYSQPRDEHGNRRRVVRGWALRGELWASSESDCQV